jgi:MFS family permease
MDDKSKTHLSGEAGTGRGGKDSGASPKSRRGLDWFVFFVADVQTGFGPFVAVYLTAQKWTQTDIGLILTVGGLIALFGQIPGGAMLDAIRSPRLAAGISVFIIGISALMLALWPIFPVVLLSRILQASASCVLGPAIAALSLGLVHRSEIGERLGRNASFASIGTGLAAAGMGICGYYVSNQAVFFVTAGFVFPALIALFQISAREIDPEQAHGGSQKQPLCMAVILQLLTNRTLVIFALCVLLFHLANAAMLPLVASMLTLRSSESAAALIAVAMVVPQFVVAIISPTIGRKSQQWGRRPLLLIGFTALVVRGVLFAAVTPSQLIVVVQILDGISAAALGVLVPLTLADITRETGRFNLTQGLVGCAMGIGAAISTTLAGFLSDRFSSYVTFLTLGAIAAIGLLAVWLLMPETRPERD